MLLKMCVVHSTYHRLHNNKKQFPNTQITEIDKEQQTYLMKLFAYNHIQNQYYFPEK